jgi:methylmalonyl-CoA/ethylmalonyl-CoA epimerase
MFEGDGVIVQTAYVVENLDKAIDYWTTNIGAGPFFVLRGYDQMEALEYRGKKGYFNIDFALGQAGTVQVELIQINSDTPSVFTDMYPKGSKGGMHHVAMFPKDIEAAIEAYRKQGLETVMRGKFGATQVAFVDARPTLGFMIELYPATDDMRGLYKMIADAAKNWDRKEKTRSL